MIRLTVFAGSSQVTGVDAAINQVYPPVRLFYMDAMKQFDLDEDRREYPRLLMSIPVQVRDRDNKNIDALLHDISPDGLQVRCNSESAREIDEVSKKDPYRDSPSIIVKFALPLACNNAEIIVRCSICYAAKLPDEAERVTAIGLQFQQFSGDSLKLIKDFFLSEMEPCQEL